MALASSSEVNLFKSLLTVVGDDTTFDSSNIVVPQQDAEYNAMLYAGLPQDAGGDSQFIATNPVPIDFNSSKFVVNELPHESYKSVKIYSIKFNHKKIISRLYSKNASEFICWCLNEGKSFDEPSVLGALSLGLQYTKSVDSLVQVMRQRQEALRLMDYEAAKTYDADIKSKQAIAADALKLIGTKFIVPQN